MFCHLVIAVPLCAVTLELLLAACSAHMWCFETFVRLHEMSLSQMLASSSCKWDQFTLLAVCFWDIKNTIILFFEFMSKLGLWEIVTDNEMDGILLHLNNSKTNKQTQPTKHLFFSLFRNSIKLKVKASCTVVLPKDLVLMFKRDIAGIGVVLWIKRKDEPLWTGWGSWRQESKHKTNTKTP